MSQQLQIQVTAQGAAGQIDVACWMDGSTVNYCSKVLVCNILLPQAAVGQWHIIDLPCQHAPVVRGVCGEGGLAQPAAAPRSLPGALYGECPVNFDCVHRLQVALVAGTSVDLMRHFFAFFHLPLLYFISANPATDAV
jgi:hypothetical protein